MFASPSLGEEGGEAVISECLIRRHVSIWLDSMLQTIKLPTTVANLTTCLANVHRDTLTLKIFMVEGKSIILKTLPFLLIMVISPGEELMNLLQRVSDSD